MDDTTLQPIGDHEFSRPLVNLDYEIYDNIHGFKNTKVDDEYTREKLRDIFSRNSSMF